MAKGIGLIGNFKGKVGNTVGYKLTASNNGQTQGIRVYQPIVKNPKSAGQAEQRAKLLAVNTTYRVLKMVIDRGNEGLPYGNKSRLAWLKGALKAEQMPWIEKGKPVTAPVGCQLTKGSLMSISSTIQSGDIVAYCSEALPESPVSTIGEVSTLLKQSYPALKDGDQITIVGVSQEDNIITSEVKSFIINPDDTSDMNGAGGANEGIKFTLGANTIAGCVIVSREGANGEHLRSTTFLSIDATVLAAAPYNAASKAAAIASYRASAATNSDWAEESIQ